MLSKVTPKKIFLKTVIVVVNVCFLLNTIPVFAFETQNHLRPGSRIQKDGGGALKFDLLKKQFEEADDPFVKASILSKMKDFRNKSEEIDGFLEEVAESNPYPGVQEAAKKALEYRKQKRIVQKDGGEVDYLLARYRELTDPDSLVNIINKLGNLEDVNPQINAFLQSQTESYIVEVRHAATKALLKRVQRQLAQRDGGQAKTIEEIVHLKNNLGANGVLGVSMGSVKLAAAVRGIQLYEYIVQYLGNGEARGEFADQDYQQAVQAVYPIMNVMNGGAHGNWVTDIQEWMIAPGFGVDMPFSQRMEMAHKVVAALTAIFKSPGDLSKILGRNIEKPFSTSVGDEGGYTPELKNNEEALKLLTAAIQKAGLTGKVRIAIDAAISALYDEESQKYNLKTDGRSLNGKEWAAQLAKWINDYDIVSTEDVFAEEHWEGWKDGFKIFGDKVLIIGDDLTVTNLNLLKKAIDEKAINSILIKINQNGSISGTLEVIQYALLNGVSVAISHRSGETEDAFISHLVVAANLFEKKPHPKTGKMPMVLLKTGGFKRSDRIAKYNEILQIEEDLNRRLAGLAPKTQEKQLGPRIITDLYATEIYDSRGNPTVQSVMTLDDGTVVRSAIPSGASTGIRESIELRDGVIAEKYPERITLDFVRKMFPGKTVNEVKQILRDRAEGKGVKFAVYNVNYLIAPVVLDNQINVSMIRSLADLQMFDRLMFDLEVKLALKSQQRQNIIASVKGKFDAPEQIINNFFVAEDRSSEVLGIEQLRKFIVAEKKMQEAKQKSSWDKGVSISLDSDYSEEGTLVKIVLRTEGVAVTKEFSSKDIFGIDELEGYASWLKLILKEGDFDLTKEKDFQKLQKEISDAYHDRVYGYTSRKSALLSLTVDMIEQALSELRDELIKATKTLAMERFAVIIDAGDFNAPSMYSTVFETLSLPGVKIGIFGSGADNLKFLLGGGNNIIAAKGQADVEAELRDQGITRIKLLPSSDNPAFAMAAILTALYNTNAVNLAFNEFYKTMPKTGVIEQKVYDSTVEAVNNWIKDAQRATAIAVAGLPGMELSETSKLAIETEKQSVTEFMAAIGV